MDGTIRVAVCDDAPAVKLFYRQVLEEEGDMEVVSSTSTGREALVDLDVHRPDALLLDVVLPDVAEPADLVAEIRERWPATSIVLMSNMPASDLEREADRLGADGWMPKAQRPDQLRETVRGILGARD
jgi:DNA-binding NarL/FixJ family response regulator